MKSRAFLIWTAVFLISLSSCGWGESAEKKEIRKTAEAYLEAERQGDLDAVWDLLAPSSDFKRGYTLDMYKAMTARGGARIKDYIIEEISGVTSQVDQGRYKDVDRIAEVAVKVVITFDDSGETAERRTSFTFVREDGRWYKG